VNLVPPVIQAGPLSNRIYGALCQDASQDIFNESPTPVLEAFAMPNSNAPAPAVILSSVLSQEEARFEFFIGLFDGAGEFTSATGSA
jgi:hypothetical protein